MKNIIKAVVVAAGVLASSYGHAQSVGQDVKKTAKKVGNKTAEVASKGASSVVDKKYDGKAGPNNESIFIDKNSAYYYVNKKGKRVYIPKEQLRDKVE